MVSGFGSMVRSGIRFKLLHPALNAMIRLRSIDRGELQRMCESQEAIWYGDTEDPFKILPPDDPQLLEAFGAYPRNFDPDQPFICELSDCYILDKNGLVLSADGKIVLESIDWTLREFIGLDQFRESRNMFVRTGFGRSITSRKYMDTTVFPIISIDNSYYHWILECLPKLRMLDKYETQTDNQPILLIESEPPRYIKETLKLAGYNPDRLHEIDNLTGNRVKSLVLAMQRPYMMDDINPARSPYSPSIADIRWLRDRIRSNVCHEAAGTDLPTRIYVSRQNSSRGRKVVNYDALVQVLEEYGFVPVLLEDISFRKQVEIFSNADIVMGPHGAGLVNVIFSDTLQIIEFLPESNIGPSGDIGPHYYNLARMLGYDYRAIVSKGAGDDLLVDVEELRVRLNEFGV